LGTGAVTFGMGIALVNGAGIALADDAAGAHESSSPKVSDSSSQGISRHHPNTPPVTSPAVHAATDSTPNASATESNADDAAPPGSARASSRSHGKNRGKSSDEGGNSQSDPTGGSVGGGAQQTGAQASSPSADSGPGRHATSSKSSAKSQVEQSDTTSKAPRTPVAHLATQVVAATAESASQAAPPVTAVAPKTAQVDAVAPSPVLPAVVHSAYAVTAYTMPTGVVPPALSAAPLSAAPTTMPSAPVSLAPLALVLAAAYPQSSASSVTATAPAATVTTSAPPSAGIPTVVATIPVDPWAIAITKDGKTIYGTSSPYATDANGMPVATVQVVDASANTQVGEPIPVGQFVAPGNIVTNPTMNRAYVVAYNPATITNPSTGYSQTGYLPSLVVIDTSTNKTIGSPIPLVTSDQTSTTMTSPGPSALAVSPDGSRVYVAGATVTSSYTGQVTSWRPTVTVFDTTTNTQVGDTLGIGPVLTNLYSGTGATSVLVSPDGKRLYVTTASNLTSSSSSSPSVTTTIYTVDSKSGAPVGNPIVLTNDAGALIPQTEALSPDGTKLYVESLSYPAITIGAQNTQPQSAQEIANATVLTFSTSTGQQVGTPINVVGYGVMTLSPDGKTLYVSDVADSRTGKKGSYQPYAGAPNQTMYDGSVTGYNLSTGKGIGAATTVGLGPTSMVVNPAGTRLYVANMADNTISVIEVAGGTTGNVTTIAKIVQGVNAAVQRAVLQVKNMIIAVQKTIAQVQQQATAQLQQIINSVKSAVDSVAALLNNIGHSISQSTTAQQFNPTASGLYSTIVTKNNGYETDKITVQLVKDSKGNYRMVVTMTGIGGSAGSMADGLQGNTGTLLPYVSTMIDGSYDRWNPKHPIKGIMLVGLSGGGEQMQAYAADGAHKNLVKDVVLFGAPLTKKVSQLTSNPRSLLIVDGSDHTYRFWTHPDVEQTYLDSPTDDIFLAGTYTPMPLVFVPGHDSTDSHNQSTYATDASVFDKYVAKNPKSVPAQISKDWQNFKGTVVDSLSFQAHNM
jgi:YVTN family beta-propeller protein